VAHLGRLGHAILAPDVDRVKIGVSERSASHRLNEIVPQSPVHLRLHSESWHRDCLGEERRMHERFGHARVIGEWFEASDPQVVAWLERRRIVTDFRDRLYTELADVVNGGEPEGRS